MADYDLAIIGGGINGTGIARDAAGRGLRVLLVEQNDLASGTSSASTKLIHGGLRYLEHGAFRLVREALHRARGAAAHGAARDPADALHAAAACRACARRCCCGSACSSTTSSARASCCRGTRTIDLTHHPVGQPLKRTFRYGFEYSDCWVDDSRLVVLNALDAAERGAVIRTRTRCVRAERARRMAADAQRARPARGRDRARAGQRRRALDRRRGRDRAAAAAAGAGAAGQGQPYRGAPAASSTIAAISCRLPTGASCSRCRSRRISR